MSGEQTVERENVGETEETESPSADEQKSDPQRSGSGENHVPRETVRKREWLRLAKYSLALGILFGLIAGSVKLLMPQQTLLLLENSAFATIFYGFSTYCRIQAKYPKLD